MVKRGFPKAKGAGKKGGKGFAAFLAKKKKK